MIAVTAIDDSATRRELATVLTGAGWAVHHALTAADALARCREHGADLVLIGEDFPGGGLALIDEVKRSSELFRTAVVLVTRGLSVDETLGAIHRGATDVLRVPLDPGDVVGRATAALRQKAMVEELTEQQAHVAELVLSDELTGLRNRRAILADLSGVLATAQRHEHPFALLMIDVDRFKAFNDEHGHAVGDEVLRETAARLTGRLREGDIAGRLGGDELLVLLPETDGAGAETVADSIRTAIGGEPFATSVGPVRVTVSLGAAAWDGEPGAALMERADAALYAAKDAGRNTAASAA